jgi:hypothetical protein
LNEGSGRAQGRSRVAQAVVHVGLEA